MSVSVPSSLSHTLQWIFCGSVLSGVWVCLGVPSSKLVEQAHRVRADMKAVLASMRLLSPNFPAAEGRMRCFWSQALSYRLP